MNTICIKVYPVFNWSIDVNISYVTQEYFIRNQGSSNLDNETEKQRLTLCLIAAIECRALHVCPMIHTLKAFVFCFMHLQWFVVDTIINLNKKKQND